MEFKLITLSKLKKFKEMLMGIINAKFDEVNQTINDEIADVNTAIDGKADTEHIHSVATTEEDGFMSSEDKAKLDDVTTYSAGAGIKIEDGVISIVDRIPVGEPYCEGFTLHGDIFLANTIIPNVSMSNLYNDHFSNQYKNVEVFQDYNYGGTKKAIARAEIVKYPMVEKLSTEALHLIDGERYWYWIDKTEAGGYQVSYNSTTDTFENKSSMENDQYVGGRLCFVNPFVTKSNIVYYNNWYNNWDIKLGDQQIY